MIRDPINDVACMGQLTTIARELARTTIISTVARRLGSASEVVDWIRSLPQTDDEGHEHVRYIECDVPQRVRLLPDDLYGVEQTIIVPLTEQQSTAIVAALRGGLQDSNRYGRIEAIYGIVDAHDTGALPLLTILAANDPDAGPISVRSTALRAIQELQQ